MIDAHIIAARRTIVAPKGGALSTLSLHDMAAPVIRAALDDAMIGPHQVDEVILSNAIGGGGNPARLAALAAGLPEHVAGLTIDRQCAGGLDAIGMGLAMVRSGLAKVVVAGGLESHSRRPIRMAVPIDGPPVAYDRPPFSPWPDRDPDLPVAADALNIPRERQDVWAMDSHDKAMNSRTALRFEIVPLGAELDDPFTRDLSPRLVARAPVVTGQLTAVNTAVAADAAAVIVIVAADLITRASVRIDKYVSIGGDPAQPALAPIEAINRLGTHDIAQAEIMEAYAAQCIATVDATGIDPKIVNPKGGALARGHPIGASGAILAVRLFHDLAGTGKSGIAAIAAAGGIGSALRVTG
ncbi:acetyl-CoA acetyltransferase [Marivivens niveibacter]|uniref:Acetyl-CoA acetyltransferase n=1 Tax=Marivivens niveibacter TaxID=1930667 RepID=A0A251WVK3_9RHOB|nr:acetyl-CoA acetyltransferase [Marivivens niveibacter]OUD08291.1 acetyl-CoA acetyltransferase [Marivivens niveibacter]